MYSQACQQLIWVSARLQTTASASISGSSWISIMNWLVLQVLGVRRSATKGEITRAFRRYVDGTRETTCLFQH
jgi:hypothetical protein